MKNKILWLVFALGFLTSLLLLMQRVVLDSNKDYSFSVDFLSVNNIHKDMGLNQDSFEKTLLELKKNGISTITLSNNNVFSLEQRSLVNSASGTELFSQTLNPLFKKEFSYVHVFNKNKEIISLLKERFSDYPIETIEHNGETYVGIGVNENKLSYLSLPFLASDVDFLVDKGFNIIFKVDNKFEGKIDTLLTDLNSYIKHYSSTDFGIEFTENGYLSFGYEEEIDLTLLPNVPYLYREHFSASEVQKGFGKVANQKDFSRLHYISNTVYSNNFKDLDVISNRVVLAISERNISFVSFQIPNVLDNVTANDIFSDFLEMIQHTHKMISDKGYTNSPFAFDQVNPILSEQVNQVLDTLSYVAATAFLLIVLNSLIALPKSIHSLALLLTVIASLFKGFSLFSLSLKIIALLYACAIPFFVFYLLLKKLRSMENISLKMSVKIYFILNIAVICLSLLLPSLHFDELYFKYIYSFSGITIATTLPIILMCLLLFFSNGRKVTLTDTLIFMKKPILIYQVLIIGIVLFLLTYYTSRSGNAGVLLPFEKELRDLMSSLFETRPRTKEFLLAQPILLFAIYFFNKNLFTRFLLPIAAIAQISIVNTFCHIHTPVIINVLRSSYGAFIGLFIGLLLILATTLIFKILNSKKNK